MADHKSVTIQLGPNEWEVQTTYKNGKIETRRITDRFEIWNIGNTGMRNPWRIPGGFKVYVESNQVGMIRKADDQKAFKKLLIEKGEIGGDPEKDKDASITRKYRLMFNKFGFAYPEISKKDGFFQDELGTIDAITPAGRRFYEATTVEAQQECFLRGLVVPMEKIDEKQSFSPLLWVLQVMLKLYELSGDYRINYIEFAVYVQTSNPTCNVEDIAKRILKTREERLKAENKKKFDGTLIHEMWAHYDKQEDNFDEYADTNIRYLVASGIVKRAGRGLTLVPESKTLATELAKKALSTESLKQRLTTLCYGAKLPTDDTDVANKVLIDLIDELNKYGIKYGHL